MDRKGIIVIVVSVILLMTWPVLVNKLYPPKPAPRPAPGTQTNATPEAAATTNVPAPAVAVTNLPPERIAAPVSTAPEELVVLENKEVRYTFTSHGGGLKLVELKNQFRAVARRQEERLAETNWVTLNTHAPLPTLALVGSETLQGDGVFKLTAATDSVRAEKVLSNGLAVIKEFRLGSNFLLNAATRIENRTAQPVSLPAQEWVVGTATPLDARDDGSMMGVFWFNGSKAEHIQAPWFANYSMGCACPLFPSNPRFLYAGGQTNVNWTAVHNQFFALAVIPPTNVMASEIFARKIVLPPVRPSANGLDAAGKPLPGRAWLLAEADILDLRTLVTRLRGSTDAVSSYLFKQLTPETRNLITASEGGQAPSDALRKAVIADLNQILRGPSIYHANREHFARVPLSESTRTLVDQSVWSEDVVRLNRLVLGEVFPRELAAGPAGYQASLVYPGTTLAANQSVERRFLVFAGPKEYKTLSRLSSQLLNEIDLLMEYNGFFGFFSKLLLLSMNAVAAVGVDYGTAIIVITIVIKLLFWPLTNISTRSMKRMAALQPQMKALQDKYKDDPQKMQRKLMEFYKEHKINPAAGCLPVLVQMPIFFGFYFMIRTAIELRGARFLWIPDLSQPDTLFLIPGLNMPFNLLPLLMGATMLWQARLTPVTPGADPMQQKMMKYMPLMFLVFLYNFSAGLTLYWTVQNLLSIAQMKLTKSKDPIPVPSIATPSPVTPKKKK